MKQKTTLLVLGLALAITAALEVAPILSEMAYATTSHPGNGGSGAVGTAGIKGGGGGAAGGKGLYTTVGHHHNDY